MSINICIYATDLYLKLITERHGGKNYVDSCKSDNLSNVSLRSCTCAKHVQSVFLCFAYTKCFDDALFREQNTKSLFVVYYPLVHPSNTFDFKN